MDWNSGMDYGKLLKAFKGFFHGNTQFYCVAIYLLTYSYPAHLVMGLLHAAPY